MKKIKIPLKIWNSQLSLESFAGFDSNLYENLETNLSRSVSQYFVTQIKKELTVPKIIIKI